MKKLISILTMTALSAGALSLAASESFAEPTPAVARTTIRAHRNGAPQAPKKIGIRLKKKSRRSHRRVKKSATKMLPTPSISQ
jgi:hypothetical protein